jgi:hypothetical protein
MTNEVTFMLGVLFYIVIDTMPSVAKLSVIKFNAIRLSVVAPS